MKKMFFGAIALVVLLTACDNNKVKEEPLSAGSEYTLLSQKTEKNKLIYGLKDESGKEILPIAYKAISMFDDQYLLAVDTEGGKFLYRPDGSKLVDKPSSYISSEEDYISFEDENRQQIILFKEGEVFAGPFTRVDQYYNILFTETAEGLVTVYTSKGQTLVSGEKVTSVFSSKEQKRYFIAWEDGKPKAYDAQGQELYKLDPDRVAKLPRPTWSRGEKIQALTTRNEMAAFRKK